MTTPRFFPSVLVLVSSLALVAQASGVVAGDASPATEGTEIVQLPEVTVTALKEPASAQCAPVSVTAVTAQTIKEANIQVVKEASVYAPNVFINEFTARKLSNPYFRGVGSSPANPGVTTYIDGVPQLNANSSNIELIDIAQIEFVRGPQGALYGRNTLGGLIHLTSLVPSLKEWTGGLESSCGSYDFREVRMKVSGPVVPDQAGFSLAGGYSARDGYTRNSFTGHDLDSREASFGKFQLQLQATEDYNARLIIFGEHDNDGDYALGDLHVVRANPRRVDHDFEGYTHRDIFAPTLLQNLRTEIMEISSITGGVWWRTSDSTDLDYTASPLATRMNSEKEYQLTQEFRFASLQDAPLELCENLKLAWQGGLFAFTQDYDQNAFNDVGVDTLYPLGPFLIPIHAQTHDQAGAALKNWGAGVYGQTTLTAWEKLDFILGLRYDYEKDKADLNPLTTTLVTSGMMPSMSMVSGRSSHLSGDSSSVSPQFGLAYQLTNCDMVYGKMTRGFKAGGFNALAPVGEESYGEETSWCYEMGAKTEWFHGKLRANAALYYIAWSDLQLNQPVPDALGRYFIGNAGAADSKGAEFELDCRPFKGWDIFGSVGYTDARFDSNSFSEHLDVSGNPQSINVSGNRLPYAPRYTANLGSQAAWELDAQWTLYARAQVTFYGDFQYDASNLVSQGSYSMADLRVGLRKRHWFTECWVANAFNTHYVPIAFEYSKSFAPSGYIGESGAPMTVGVRAGMNF
ncbi:MAG: TonB-dependent receptor [Verrucomicrobia bacterium]|nr:TonB-dependent receptor [Verrucomicrobiota bacterium]